MSSIILTSVLASPFTENCCGPPRALDTALWISNHGASMVGRMSDVEDAGALLSFHRQRSNTRIY